MSKQLIIGKNLFLFSFSVFLLDQISKKLVQLNWPGFLFCNQAMALSLPKINLLFWTIFGFFMLFIFWEISRKPTSIPYYLMVGGALSNLTDRLFHGCVWDWIALGSFPVFNLADAAICWGAGWLIVQSLKKNR